MRVDMLLLLTTATTGCSGGRIVVVETVDHILWLDVAVDHPGASLHFHVHVVQRLEDVMDEALQEHFKEVGILLELLTMRSEEVSGIAVAQLHQNLEVAALGVYLNILDEDQIWVLHSQQLVGVTGFVAVRSSFRRKLRFLQ